MKKIFDLLLKPARMVLLIGSFVFAAWFVVSTAGYISGGFISVMSSLILMMVGAIVLCAVPVCLLIKKEDIAKIVFFILVSYWLLSTIQSVFNTASWLTEFGDGLSITAGIFLFFATIGLVGVLALIVLNFILKKPFFRLLAWYVFFGVVGFAFIGGLLQFIYYIVEEWDWVSIIDVFVNMLLVPSLIGFGVLYFVGAPAIEEKAAPKAEEKAEAPKAEEAPANETNE